MPQAPTPEDGEAGTSRHATHPTYPLLQCSISKTLPRKASYSPRTHTWRDTVRHTPAPPISLTRLTLLPRLSASGFTSRCSRRARRPVCAPLIVLVALLVPLLVFVALLATLLNIARSSRAISRFATNFFSGFFPEKIA